jgi:hypothetical protein
MIKTLNKIKTIFKPVVELFWEKKIFGLNLGELSSKTLMVLILVMLIVSMMPSERPFEYGNLVIGSIAQNEIIAPFTFPVIKSQKALEQERQSAWDKQPAVFRKNPEVKGTQEIKLKNFLAELSVYFQKAVESRKQLPIQREQSTEMDQVDSLLSQFSIKYNLELSRDDILFLFKLHQNKKLRDYSRHLNSGLQALYNRGILNLEKSEIKGSKITLIQNGMEEIFETQNLLDKAEAKVFLEEVIQSRIPGDGIEYQLAFKILSQFFKPDLIYDKELTSFRKEKAVREVPTTSGFVHENQRVIDDHEIVTEEVYQKLQSLAIALAEKNAGRSGWHQFLFYLGKYLFALMIVFIIGSYLAVYHPKLYAQPKMLWLITSIFVIQLLATMLMLDLLNWGYLSIPVTLSPMLLSMLLDPSIAFVGTIVISLVLGAAAGNNFFLALMTFVVGTIALFSVQKIRNRGQMFRAILFIMLGYGLVNFSYGFIHYESLQQMLRNFAFYLLPNAVLTPTAVFLLIGLFEKSFDVTTDITLLELSDLNHPLLKRLSVEAPGTFHHSIIVGNLAEAAAKEINANSLLARVGCYYHDIGKMLMSEYFVENQPGKVSKHESLTPNMSSLILAKHVRAGIELGDQYSLPLAVKKFIPEHHGTSIMSYFYHKALETADPKDINENDFRYPGPKPQSRETAIAMLADTVEAASRTLPNPNLQRISALVENLIEKRFQEELDECDITLRELNKIKGAFVRILMGIHHLRIEYPTEEKSREKNWKTGDLKEHSEEIEFGRKGNKKDRILPEDLDPGSKANPKNSESSNGSSPAEYDQEENKT